MSCKKIAEQAANDYQKTNNRLATDLKSHYNQALKKCYYEFLISVNLAGSYSGSVSTDIRVSPDDDWIAECSTNVYPAPKLFCTQHNIGVITEQQFKQFEDTYFNN